MADQEAGRPLLLWVAVDATAVALLLGLLVTTLVGASTHALAAWLVIIVLAAIAGVGLLPAILVRYAD